MEETKTKVCSCCGEEKPVADFYKHGKTPDGFSHECKACRIKRATAFNAKSRIEPVFHDELSKYMPRDLMEHLSALGYKGTLQIPHNITL